MCEYINVTLLNILYCMHLKKKKKTPDPMWSWNYKNNNNKIVASKRSHDQAALHLFHLSGQTRAVAQISNPGKKRKVRILIFGHLKKSSTLQNNWWCVCSRIGLGSPHRSASYHQFHTCWPSPSPSPCFCIWACILAIISCIRLSWMTQNIKRCESGHSHGCDFEVT